MTSTLQQDASRKLRYTAQTTMRVAQRLYENGYITYMRTDSTTLSESALTAARKQARELYGDEYVLYELIWMRTIASQMKDAAGQTVSLRIGGTSSAGEKAEFGASG